MKKAIRFLIPVAAMLAMFAFAACDSGDGETTEPGLCDDVTCDAGQTCDPADGVCKDDPVTCDPACEDGFECVDGECVEVVECDPACEDGFECVAGECVEIDLCADVTCEDGKECVDGECVIVDPCADVECDACEECNAETGECESTCEDGDVCYQDACCTPACDGLDCGTDSCGGTCGLCDDGYFCNGEQACQENPTVTCQNADAAYCDATIVNELVIAEAPDAAAGEPGCCCDYDGDGAFDNAVAGLIANVGSMADMDLASLNEMVAEQLAEGSVIVLFEMIGLEGMDASEFFNMNFLLGEDTDDDATNNFNGDAEFTVMAESLDPVTEEPLIQFEGATLSDAGVLSAPGADGTYGQFIIPVAIEEYNIDLAITIDGVRLQADLAQTDGMYEMANGTLCGYITAEQIFGALNEFTAGNCGCLNIDGDLVIDNGDGTFTCNTPTATPTCDPEVGLEEVCGYLTQYCSTALTLIPMFLDVDTDGDPSTGEGISLGATFGATSAVIVEGAVE